MNRAEYLNLCRKVWNECMDLGNTKGVEYARSTNVHDNFDRLAVNLRLIPEQVLLVYLTKHLDAINSYVTGLAGFEAPRSTLSEPIEGRINDAINYLMLFRAMVERSKLPKAETIKMEPIGRVEMIDDEET